MQIENLLQALSFAARAHQGQLRKDGRTPYAAHPSRVCLIVRQVFGFDDPEILAAAALHDTIEDTTTDYDDILEHFGSNVANWVRAMTKDKRLEEIDREKAYIEQLLQADWQVHIIKLADILDNSIDSKHMDAARKEKANARYQQYLHAFKSSQHRNTIAAIQKLEEVIAALP
jgi:guanosine-3',5'-bis(diphosphate) 3'-pyrophosphohydrolase